MEQPTANIQPALGFFRDTPDGLTESEFIASSLQSLESSFFLIALDRYPHALLLCASAIEGVLRSAGMGSGGSPLQERIDRARERSAAIAAFSLRSLDELRKARNHYVHHGFSPKDDSVSVGLYLEVGVPFLDLCYRELHAFDLMDGLLMEYTDPLRVAQRVHAAVKDDRSLDVSYCLRAFRDGIRLAFNMKFSSQWQILADQAAEDGRTKFDAVQKRKQKLEELFDYETWAFHCPVCHDLDTAVARIDFDALKQHAACINRLACASCQFGVLDSEPLLAQYLLEPQIVAARDQILTEYGML